jgi:hypothetical protein
MNTVSLIRRNDEPLPDDGGLPPGGAPPPNDADAARADRARAEGLRDRLAAGETSPPKPYDCDNFADGAKHDFDRCVNERLRGSSATGEQRGNLKAFDARDVRQGRVGDCFFMAPLSALASTPSGRTLIDRAIVENKNQRGEVLSYTVTLYKAELHWLRSKTFSEVKITVDPIFARGHAEASITQDGTNILSVVVEKAYAVYCGGYNRLNQGGLASDAMEALTGKAAESFSLGWLGYSSSRLEKDLASGKMVVINSRKDIAAGGRSDLVASHSYQVTGTCRLDGKLCVLLHSPREDDDPKPIPFDDLGTWFARVDVGSVR